MAHIGWSHFFNLAEFVHRELLIEADHVWGALEKLEDYLLGLPLGECHGTVSSEAHLVKRELIWIGEGTVVEPGAYVEGPAILGRNCIVRHGAYIRGNLLAGNNCVIGHTTEVKNSVFLDGAKAAHFAYVGDSILGNDVNLGAGVRCANYRLDGNPVSICIDGQRIDTFRTKLGAIIGDRTGLGCNCVTNPGTLLAPDSRCFPCTCVSTNLRVSVTAP